MFIIMLSFSICILVNFNCSNNTSLCKSVVLSIFVSSVSGKYFGFFKGGGLSNELSTAATAGGGGDDELLRGIGKDATELFNQVHAWVNYESLLHKCYVGRLVYSESNFGPPIINKASNLIGKLFIKKGKS